jgi:TRAP-type C4-dicarboxylate transport system substrate-binding protein
VRASIQSPAKSLLSKGFDWLLDEIEKKTEGRVKFQKYYSGSLAKPAEQLRAASTGLAGLSLVVPSYVPAQLPLANVGSNPALWKDSWTGSKAYAALYEKVPAMADELDKQGVKLVSAFATPTYYLLGRKVDLNSLKQLEGMRIMSSGQIAVMLQSLGAQIVSIPTPEGYEAMQRGTVDGAVYGLTAAATYGIQNVTQSLWKLPVGGLPLLVVMNKGEWGKISKQDQEIIKQVAEQHADAFHKIYQVGGDEASLKKFEQANVKIIEPDKEALTGLRAAAQKVWDKWAQEQNAAGRPGTQVLDTFVKLSDEYAEKNPFLKK